MTEAIAMIAMTEMNAVIPASVVETATDALYPVPNFASSAVTQNW
jgi:hypothetical protein